MTSEQIYEVQRQLTSAHLWEWTHEQLPSLKLWALLALFLLTVYLSWKYSDKKRLKELALFTAIVVIFVIILDEFGEELSLWYYTVDIIPLFPPMTAIDMSCLPMVYLFIYQKTNNWKSFLIAMAIASIIFCFLLEPLFVLLGIYCKLTWKYYYGFPIYIFIAVIAKWIVQSIFSFEKKRRERFPAE